MPRGVECGTDNQRDRFKERYTQEDKANTERIAERERKSQRFKSTKNVGTVAVAPSAACAAWFPGEQVWGQMIDPLF